MKKSILLTILMLPFVLSSCQTTDPDDGKTALVNFFVDYNHADEKDPYYSYDWYELVPLEDIPDNPPMLTEGFPVFLGWSDKPIIDTKDDLWDFEVDTIKVGQYYLALYGIWVADGEI